MDVGAYGDLLGCWRVPRGGEDSRRSPPPRHAGIRHARQRVGHLVSAGQLCLSRELHERSVQCGRRLFHVPRSGERAAAPVDNRCRRDESCLCDRRRCRCRYHVGIRVHRVAKFQRSRSIYDGVLHDCSRRLACVPLAQTSWNVPRGTHSLADRLPGRVFHRQPSIGDSGGTGAHRVHVACAQDRAAPRRVGSQSGMGRVGRGWGNLGRAHRHRPRQHSNPHVRWIGVCRGSRICRQHGWRALHRLHRGHRGGGCVHLHVPVHPRGSRSHDQRGGPVNVGLPLGRHPSRAISAPTPHRQPHLSVGPWESGKNLWIDLAADSQLSAVFRLAVGQRSGDIRVGVCQSTSPVHHVVHVFGNLWGVDLAEQRSIGVLVAPADFLDHRPGARGLHEFQAGLFLGIRSIRRLQHARGSGAGLFLSDLVSSVGAVHRHWRRRPVSAREGEARGSLSGERRAGSRRAEGRARRIRYRPVSLCVEFLCGQPCPRSRGRFGVGLRPQPAAVGRTVRHNFHQRRQRHLPLVVRPRGRGNPARCVGGQFVVGQYAVVHQTAA